MEYLIKNISLPLENSPYYIIQQAGQIVCTICTIFYHIVVRICVHIIINILLH